MLDGGGRSTVAPPNPDVGLAVAGEDNDGVVVVGGGEVEGTRAISAT